MPVVSAGMYLYILDSFVTHTVKHVVVQHASDSVTPVLAVNTVCKNNSVLPLYRSL